MSRKTKSNGPPKPFSTLASFIQIAVLLTSMTRPPCPLKLCKTHQQNNKAVMQAYGFSVKDMTESKCVAELMKIYQVLTEK